MMRSVGIVCEYNPFHAGHVYLLHAAKEEGAAVCLMSGNFTQRGEAAVLPPTVRAEMAICGGADLVLELPFPFAASSAEHFARGAVRAFAGLGIDLLFFGSECGNTEKITHAARRLLSPTFRERWEKEGKGSGAVRVLFDYLGEEFSSNDILAIQYVKAILEENIDMEPVAVRRVGAGYRDENAGLPFPSAASLRKELEASGDIAALLPEKTRQIFQAGQARFGIADIRRLGVAFLAMLRRTESEKGLFRDAAECEGGVLSLLLSAATHADDYDSLCRMAATKTYTNGRIRRALLMLLAGVRCADLKAPPSYLRLLSFDKTGRNFLADCRKTRTIPVITKQSDLEKLGGSVLRQRDLARISDGLYSLCFPKPIPLALLQTVPPSASGMDLSSGS